MQNKNETNYGPEVIISLCTLLLFFLLFCFFMSICKYNYLHTKGHYKLEEIPLFSSTRPVYFCFLPFYFPSIFIYSLLFSFTVHMASLVPSLYYTCIFLVCMLRKCSQFNKGDQTKGAGDVRKTRG